MGLVLFDSARYTSVVSSVFITLEMDVELLYGRSYFVLVRYK